MRWFKRSGNGRNLVAIVRPDKFVFALVAAEQLDVTLVELKQQLGWKLPISHLTWWVRGLPAPDSKSTVTLDSDSHLQRLTQDGWQVEYLSYTEQNGYWLPERLKLHGRDLDVTLVVKDWQPRQLGQ